MNATRLPRRALGVARLVLLVLAPLAALDALPAFLRWRYDIADADLDLRVGRLQTGVLCVLAAVLALRVVGRHPIARAAYLAWLTTTPWRPGLPLPLGPVTPAAGDVLRLGIVAAAAPVYFRASPAPPLLAFAVTFAVAAGIVLPRIGPRPAGVAVWVLLAGAVRAAPDVPVTVALVLLAYVVAHAGTLASLRGYPWGADERPVPEPALGPVFERLGPRVAKPAVGAVAAAAAPPVLGWAAYCLLAHSPVNLADDGGSGGAAGAYTIAGLVGLLLALIRWAAYSGFYHPPITLRGRLRTGRLILPRHDVVLVSPLTVALIAGLLPVTLASLGCSPAAAIGVTTAAALAVLLNGPPTLAGWRLTGQSRVVLTGGTGNGSPRARDAAKAGVNVVT